MSVVELADTPLVDLGGAAVGVRTSRIWTVYVPGCRPGHGETYLAAFVDALKSKSVN